MQPLTTKFQPETLNEFVNQRSIKKDASKWIARGDIETHKLFHGSYGLGKTTLAYIIKKELDVPNRDFKEINCSNRGQEIVDEAIQFLRTTPLVEPETGYKLMVMDEFHNLQPRFQKKLRKPVQKYEDRVRIIFIANQLSAVEDAIVDRATPYKFKPFDHKDIERLVLKTLEQAGWTISESNLDIIKENADGSPRHALKLAQELAER